MRTNSSASYNILNRSKFMGCNSVRCLQAFICSVRRRFRVICWFSKSNLRKVVCRYVSEKFPIFAGQTSYNPGDRFKLNTSTLTPSVGTSDQHVEDSTISGTKNYN